MKSKIIITLLFLIPVILTKTYLVEMADTPQDGIKRSNLDNVNKGSDYQFEQLFRRALSWEMSFIPGLGK